MSDVGPGDEAATDGTAAGDARGAADTTPLV
jgi:hypothetical protein